MRLRWWVVLALGVALTSFGGLYYLIMNIWPAADRMLAAPQLLFFLFTFVGAGSTSIPIAAYLNYRFAKPDWLQRDKMRLLRQGCWVGFVAIGLAYLQLLRALTATVAIALATAFVLIELFFLTRE